MSSDVREIGIRQLNRDTGRIVREAAAGATFVVTEHNRPIADLTPHLKHTGLHRYVAAGLLDKLPIPVTDATEFRTFPGDASRLDEEISGTDEDFVW